MQARGTEKDRLAVEEDRHRDRARQESECGHRLADQLAADERLCGQVATALDQLLAFEALETPVGQGRVGPGVHKKTHRSLRPSS